MSTYERHGVTPSGAPIKESHPPGQAQLDPDSLPSVDQTREMMGLLPWYGADPVNRIASGLVRGTGQMAKDILGFTGDAVYGGAGSMLGLAQQMPLGTGATDEQVGQAREMLMNMPLGSRWMDKTFPDTAAALRYDPLRDNKLAYQLGRNAVAVDPVGAGLITGMEQVTDNPYALTAAAMLPTGIRAGFGAGGSVLRGGPSAAQGMKAALQQQRGLGFKPTAATLVPESLAAMLERASSGMIGGRKHPRAAALQAEKATEEFFDQAIKDYFPGLETSRTVASSKLSDSIENDWLNYVRVEYDKFDKELTRLMRDPKTGQLPIVTFEKSVEKLEEMISKNPDAKKMLEEMGLGLPEDLKSARLALQDIYTGAYKTMPFDSAQEVLRGVGRAADHQNLVAPETQRYWKALYGAMSQDLEAAITPRARKHWNQMKRWYKDGAMSTTENTLNPLLRKRMPEQIYETIMRGSEKSPTFIRRIQRAVNPEAWNHLRLNVLRELGMVGGRKRTGIDDEYSFVEFIKNLNKIHRTPNGMGALFTLFPETGLRESLLQLAKIGGDIRVAEPGFLSAAARSAGAIVTLGAGMMAPSWLLTGHWNIAGALVTSSAGIMGGARVTSSAMHSPRFLDWLSTTLGERRRQPWGEKGNKWSNPLYFTGAPGFQKFMNDSRADIERLLVIASKEKNPEVAKAMTELGLSFYEALENTPQPNPMHDPSMVPTPTPELWQGT